MKPMAIHLIMARIIGLTLEQQIDYLHDEWRVAKRYSGRRNELESLLCSRRTKQLLREARQARAA